MTNEERNMLNLWGRRCGEYARGCPCCAAWRLFDALGRVPRDDEIDSLDTILSKKGKLDE